MVEVMAEEKAMGETFDNVANVSLLRHYLCAPARRDAGLTARVLVMSLMRLPEPYFANNLAILPENVQQTPAIAGLANAARALENARFADFWSAIGHGAADASSHPVAAAALSVPGFEDAVRRYALNVIGITYVRAPVSIVAEAVALDGAALDAYVKQHRPAWTRDGDSFLIPQADAGTGAAGAASEVGISVAALAPFLSARS